MVGVKVIVGVTVIVGVLVKVGGIVSVGNIGAVGGIEVNGGGIAAISTSVAARDVVNIPRLPQTNGEINARKINVAVCIL